MIQIEKKKKRQANSGKKDSSEDIFTSVLKWQKSKGKILARCVS